MTEPTFKVILQNRIQEGEEFSVVARRLAALFQIDESQARRLLQTGAVIKQDLGSTRAERYRLAVEQTGAVCRLEPMTNQRPALALVEDDITPSADPTKPPASQSSTAPLSKCPKCGYQARHAMDPLVSTAECPACGLIIAKYLARQNALNDLPSRSNRNSATQLQEALLGHAAGHAVGSLKKAFILISILSALFGSGLVINTLFFTRDYHVLYQLVTTGMSCFTLEDVQGGASSAAREQIVGMIMRDYHFNSNDELKSFFQRYHGKVCTQLYQIEIGNIGKKTVKNLSFRMREEVFQGMFADGRPELHLHLKAKDLNAANPRNGDPSLVQGDDSGVITIQDVSAGASVQVSFLGLRTEPESPVDWKYLLLSTHIDEGKVERGNPQATALGRLLL